MSSFPITLIHVIEWENSIWLKREIVLPFVPYPGLVILLDNEGFSVNEVHWRADKDRFEVYDLPDDTLCHCPAEDIAQIVLEYKDLGWTELT